MRLVRQGAGFKRLISRVSGSLRKSRNGLHARRRMDDDRPYPCVMDPAVSAAPVACAVFFLQEKFR